MNRSFGVTSFIYLLLVGVFLVRLNAVCEQQLSACAERLQQEKYLEQLEHSKKKSNWLYEFREKIVSQVRADLPSPHSELLLGMTLGIDKFDELPIFNVMLRNTGTIHVVVVSGYNVTLVYTFVLSLIGSMYKSRNLALALLATLFYAVVTGFEPPVVRAWFMGSLLIYGKYYGLRLNMLLVMIFTALVLLCIDPSYIFSLSFKLSFVATLSLIIFDDLILERIESKNVLITDLKSTLAAQVMVWPIISFYFGQVSLISPLVNMLVLWTVPIATVLGSVYIMIQLINFGIISSVLSWVLFFPLDIFSRVVELFSLFESGVVMFQVRLFQMLIYYVLVAFFAVYKQRRRS